MMLSILVTVFYLKTVHLLEIRRKGITFIGPDADLLERIKDKLQAKRILEEAGIRWFLALGALKR